MYPVPCQPSQPSIAAVYGQLWVAQPERVIIDRIEDGALVGGGAEEAANRDAAKFRGACHIG